MSKNREIHIERSDDIVLEALSLDEKEALDKKFHIDGWNEKGRFKGKPYWKAGKTEDEQYLSHKKMMFWMSSSVIFLEGYRTAARFYEGE